MNTSVLFSRQSDEWQTPVGLFQELHREFNFSLDAAATRENAQCERYFSLADRNALTVSWCGEGTIWLNPPYSQCREFIAKAAGEARKGCTVVCLVPSRTDTRWWHEFIWNAVSHGCRPGVEVRFLRGRLRFVGAPASAPFPSVVLVMRPNG
jgi:phage N-6-adenine-methyltransferase